MGNLGRYHPDNGSKQREAPVQIDFRSSERSSLGVEAELEMVDMETRELRSGASEVLPPQPGPIYIRQREVIAAGGAMTDVDSLVTELRTDRLTPTPKPAIP